uniref:Uncharacterized protein n=1 Tax=Anguilla anguilla TaxID=7936 RepID=A0A0E9V8I2_ANGAN
MTSKAGCVWSVCVCVRE